MQEFKAESSLTLYWALRILLVPMVLLLASVFALTFFDPSALGDGREPMTASDVWGLRVLILLLSPMVIIVALRLARIEYGYSGLTAYRNGKKADYTWSEIASVQKVPFWTPPIYRVSFCNAAPPIYFGMSWSNVSIGFWSWDFSGFYAFAKGMVTVEKGKKTRCANKTVDPTPGNARRDSESQSQD